MSLPELRCLLCDRALLDETTALPAERCQQCGKLMKPEEPAVAPIVPPGEQAGFTPGEGSLLTTFDELPEAVPVVQARAAPVLNAAEVPVVQPRAAPVMLPVAPKPRWVPPIQSHPPVPPHEDQIERPKPKFGCALFVVLAFMVLSLLAVTFIVYAIARGLRKTPKTEPSPTKVVTEAKPTPDKPKARDPELVPVPVSSLWIPPRGNFRLSSDAALTTAVAPLPGASSHGVLAGNARFILFPAPSAQLIAVFDVTAAKVLGYLPMPDRDSLIASTANHAIVLSPAGASISRFDLSTLKHERTELNGDLYGDPKALVAGHSSGGPIYLLASDKGAVRLRLLNPETFQPIEWKAEIAPFKKTAGVFTGNFKVDRAYLRASANGRVLLGGIAAGKQNFRVDRLELIGANPVIGPTTISIGSPAFPTSDGGLTAFDTDPKTTRFPVAEGNGFFEIADKGGSKVATLTFIGEGHVQRAEVKDIVDFADAVGLEQDRRAFYIPSAQAFVHLGADGKTIHWRRVKLGEELAKPGADYLLFAGAPPAVAVRGDTFRYEPKLLSNFKDATFRLDTAPAAMQVEGKAIVWEVPDSAPEGDVAIELAAESQLKPKVAAKQRFTVQVLTTAPATPNLSAPIPQADRTPRAQKAGLPNDPLKFTAEPSRTAKRGQTYRAKFALSTPADATVHIRAAPAGAAWDGGDLVWNVPADFPLEPLPVVVTAQTGTGQQVSLGYLLVIQE